ncbi:MAG TPA: hypothetical protein VFW92_11105 [Candidatus Limnocylindrales bacterium]|nr:hypothetical protein [Candidatus Limnocylindrales bacterium]
MTVQPTEPNGRDAPNGLDASSGPTEGADPTETGRPGGSQDSTDAALLARLDWRFLLPDPDPRRWRWCGPERGGLRAALDQLVAPTAGSPGRSSVALAEQAPGSIELVVAASAHPEDLDQAFAALRPGGWLYLELGGAAGRSARRPPAAGLRGALHRAGFREADLVWPWPDHERTTRMMPLGRATPRIGLERAGDALPRKVASRGASLLGGLGLLPAMVPAVRAVAHRPGPEPGRPVGLLGALLAAPERYGLAGLGLPSARSAADWLLLTPRFRSSRHVTLLAGPSGGPAAVAAKLARRSGDGEAIAHTAAILSALAAQRAGLATLPRLLAHDVWAGRSLLVTSIVPGRPLDPVRIRRGHERYSEAVLAWQLRLPHAGERPLGEAIGCLVDPALAALEALGASVRPLAQLAARTRSSLAAAGSELAIPTVFEHGDLSHPNLLWSEADGLGVVDWELARPDGLPLHDLSLFVAYLAGAVAGARDDQAVVNAFEAAVLAPEGWARPILGRYARAMALPSSAVAPLVVSAWARLLGGLPGRTGQPEDTSMAWLAEHRFAGLLRASLDGWSSLAAIGGPA